MSKYEDKVVQKYNNNNKIEESTRKHSKIK